MAANVDPEEAQALLDLCEPPAGGASEIRPRDFARPMRLTPEELEGLALKVRRALPGISGALARSLRNRHALTLVEICEVSSERLFDSTPENFSIVRFTVGGQPAWLVWDLLPAIAAVEVALGAGQPAVGSERALSTIERAVLTRLVEPLVTDLCAGLGLAAKGVSVPKMREELGSWRDGGERADHRRLLLHLAFDGPGSGGPGAGAPGAASSMRFYLPGIDPARPSPERSRAAALPARLAEIQVDLAAHLGASHVPLAELLGLEPGDVIPLTAPADKPLRIYVEGRLHARAVLGKKDGRLAIRIVEIGPEDEDA